MLPAAALPARLASGLASSLASSLVSSLVSSVAGCLRPACGLPLCVAAAAKAAADTVPRAAARRVRSSSC